MGWRLGLRTALVAGSLLTIVGAFGPWGSLSSVPEQAQIVESTRYVIAGLAVIGASAPLIGQRYAIAGVLGFVAFLVAGVVTYGEMGYEENQSVQYGVSASTTGLTAAMVGTFLGAMAALALAFEVATRAKPRPESGEPQAPKRI